MKDEYQLLLSLLFIVSMFISNIIKVIIVSARNIIFIFIYIVVIYFLKNI